MASPYVLMKGCYAKQVFSRLIFFLKGRYHTPRLSEINAEATVESVDAAGLYQYDSLAGPDSIRLVELLPLSDGEDIKICLHVTTLLDSPAYQTLSYEWGETIGTHPIWCHGATLLVTSNLLAALERLRLPSLRRFLWIDAICINQEDLEERAQQVSIMGDIYKQCHKVLIWIGEAGPSTSEALAKLPELAREQTRLESVKEEFIRKVYEDTRLKVRKESVHAFIHSQRQQWYKEWSEMFDELSKPNLELLEISSKELWLGIHDLFSRSYFERLWIVQEVVLSPKAVVLCGNDICDWIAFFKAARYVHAMGDVIAGPNVRILDLILQISDLQGNLSHKHAEYYKYLLHHLLESEEDVWIAQNFDSVKELELKTVRSLTSLLICFSACKARDPRDLVFALLSLLQESSQRQIQANYSLSTAHVYKQAIMTAISEDAAVTLLLQEFTPPSICHIAGTPSWVPDFSCNQFWSVDNEICGSIPPPFTAPPSAADGSIFYVNGVKFDRVAWCTNLISRAEMYHFDPSSGPEMCLPDMKNFILVSSAKDYGEVSEWKSRAVLETSFADLILSANGRTALQENGILLDALRIEASGDGNNLQEYSFGDSDTWKEWLMQWKAINTPYRSWEGTERRQLNSVYGYVTDPEGEDQYWRKQYNLAQRQWSDCLYVHKYGRQLFKTIHGTLGLGPVGINGIQYGDIIVSLHRASRYFVLRSLGDGTYTFRGTVILEKHLNSFTKKCMADSTIQGFRIR